MHDITLGDSVIVNDLEIVSNGNIDASNGALVVGGDTFMDANDGFIALTNPENAFFGEVFLQNFGTNAIELVNSTDLQLGGIFLDDGALTITANDGHIIQNGRIEQTGTGNVTITAEEGFIKLDNFNNDFQGTLFLSAFNAVVFDMHDITLGDSVIANDLFILTDGNIDASNGALVVGGDTFMDANDGFIALTNPDNAFFGQVFLQNFGTNAIELVNSTDLELGDIFLDDGALSITANNGHIIQSGRIQQSGTGDVTIMAEGGSIELDNFDNQFSGAVSLNSGVDALLMNDGAITLAESFIGGDLTVETIAGNITQIGALEVGGAATFTLANGSDIALNNSNNNLQGEVSFAVLSGQLNNVAFTNNQDIILDALDITGDLTLNSTAGGIQQVGALQITGIATLIAIDDITLNVLNADRVTVDSLKGSITQNGALTVAGLADFIAGSDITLAVLNANALEVYSENGFITQTGALQVTDFAYFTITGTGMIELMDPNNQFGSLDLDALSASVDVGDSVELGSVDIANTLNLIAHTGSITQANHPAAVITVGGLADLSAATDIILDNFQNDFTSLKLTGVNATVTNNSALALAGANLSGTLDLTLSNGSITQLTDPMAALLIDGTATFTVQDGQSITLNNDFNDIAGDVIFNGALASLGLTNTASITLGALNLSGDLTLNSIGGSVGQTVNVAWVIGGSADLSALNAITLGELNITDDLILNSTGGSVRQSDPWVVGGLADLSAATDIILDNFPNDFASLKLNANDDAFVQDINDLTLGDSVIANDLFILSDGNIDASNGALIVGGDTFMDAGNGAILLSNTKNLFFGQVFLQNFGTNAIELVNSTDLELGDIFLDDGALSITVNNGDIIQNGRIEQTGTGNVTITAEEGSIELDNFNNDFQGTLFLSAFNAVVFDMHDITLGDSVIANDLFILSNGNIDASNGALIVGGDTFMDANDGFIALTNPENAFFGEVFLQNFGTNAIKLVNSTDLQLGDIFLDDGALSITVNNGDIIQNGRIEQTGTGNVTITAEEGSIELDNFNNDFQGTLFLSAFDAVVFDMHDITLGDSVIANDLFILSDGNIDASNGALVVEGDIDILADNGSILLGDIFLDDGALSITANNGHIIQSGRIEQTGTGAVTITAEEGSIQLDNFNNDFQGTLFLSAFDAVVFDMHDITLGDSVIANDLFILSDGNIDASNGALVVEGDIDILANNGSILLGDIFLDDGALSITANNGHIIQSGRIEQTGTGDVKLTAEEGSIELDNFNNDFQGTLFLSAFNAVVFDMNDITLGDSVIANDLFILSDGNIDASNGALIVGGDTFMDAGNGAILLSNTNNLFFDQVFLQNFGTNAIELVNSTDLELGDIFLDDGALSITVNNGHIIQNGRIEQTGTGAVTITAEEGSIELDNFNNDFQGTLFLSAFNAVVFDMNDITLGDSVIVNDLEIVSNGNIDASNGALVVGDDTFMDAGNGAILLSNTNNLFFDQVFLQNFGTNAIELVNSTDLELGDIFLDDGALSITVNNGHIIQSGRIEQTGTGDVKLTAEEGSIELDNFNNDFQGTLFLSAFNAVVFDMHDITLGDSVIVNDLEIVSNGNIDASNGALIVGGDTFMDANDGFIALTNPENAFFGEVFLQNFDTNAIKLVNSTDLQLGDIFLDDGALTITVNNGHIIQSGRIQQSGTGDVTIMAEGGSIELDNFDNQFSGAVSLNSGVDALLMNDGAITLAESFIGGDLTVETIAGNITQIGALEVGGAATFTLANGSDIALNNSNNNLQGEVSFAVLSGQLNNVAFTNNQDIILDALDITGDLTLNSTGGGVYQFSYWVVGGLADLSAAADISLKNADNDFASLKLTGVNATVSNNSALALAGANLSGTLDLTLSNGSITQLTDPMAALLIDGTATFTVQDGESITLNNDFNDIAGDVIFNGALATLGLTNTASITLGALNLSGDLTLNSTTGSIGQTAAWVVGGLADLTAATNITLQQTQNDFASLKLTGANATVSNNSALALAGADLSGDLDLSLNTGSVSQTGALDVAGNANFTVTGGESIVLADPANAILGNVSFTSTDANPLGDVSFTNSNTITLDALSAASIDLSSITGGIQQVGALQITDSATFVAIDDITLNVLSAARLTVDSLRGSITQNGALTVAGLVDFIAGSDITLAVLNANALEVYSEGSFITQTGALQVTDLADFTITGTGMIELMDPNNQFGSLDLNALSASVDVDDSVELGLVNIANTLNLTAHTGSITQSNDTDKAITIGGSADLSALNAITLGELDITGDLTLNSTTGSIGQTAAWVVGGLADLSAATDIILDNFQNDFTNLKLTGVNATVSNNSALALAGANLSGTLDLTLSNGSITQLTDDPSEALLIDGTATFTVQDDESITLNNPFNDIAGDVIFNGALASLGLTNTASITLGALNLSGDLTLNSIGGSVGQTANVVWVIGGSADLSALNAITLGELNITDDLTLNSTGGSVGQTAAWVVGGLADLSAAIDITLQETQNDFASLKLTGANATVSNNSALALAGADLSGDLDLSLNTGSVSQTGALDVAGNANFTVTGGESIVLADPANAILGNVSFTSTGANPLGDVSFTNSNTITLDALSAASIDLSSITGGIQQVGALQITDSATFVAIDDITLNVLSAARLTVDSLRGSITQNGALTVAGLVDFIAGSDITLAVLNANALEVYSEGSFITQTGALQVTDLADFTITGTGMIELMDPNNQFGSLDLNALSASVDVDDSVELGLVNIANTLNLTAHTGSITQSNDTNKAMTVGGTAVFTLTDGSDIALHNPNNNLQGPVSFAALTGQLNNVEFTNSQDIDLAALDITGGLTIAALTGDITQTGALIVAGSASFTVADGASIILNDAGNNILGNVSFTEVLQELAFVNNQDISLGALNIAGGLTLHAIGGDITQTDAWTVGGLADLTASDGEPFSRIVLDNLQNDFASLKLNADRITLSNRNKLILDDQSTDDDTVLGLQVITTRPLLMFDGIIAAEFNGGAMGLFGSGSSNSLPVIAE